MLDRGEDIAVGSGVLSSLMAETKERNRRCMQESGVSEAVAQHNLSLEGETSGSDMINSLKSTNHLIKCYTFLNYYVTKKQYPHVTI